MEQGLQVAHKACNIYCLALCRKFEDIGRQSGQGVSLRKQRLSRNTKGQEPVIRIAQQPRSKAIRCKGSEAEIREEHAVYCCFCCPFGVGLFELSYWGLLRF